MHSAGDPSFRLPLPVGLLFDARTHAATHCGIDSSCQAGNVARQTREYNCFHRKRSSSTVFPASATSMGAWYLQGSVTAGIWRAYPGRRPLGCSPPSTPASGSPARRAKFICVNSLSRSLAPHLLSHARSGPGTAPAHNPAIAPRHPRSSIQRTAGLDEGSAAFRSGGGRWPACGAAPDLPSRP